MTDSRKEFERMFILYTAKMPIEEFGRFLDTVGFEWSEEDIGRMHNTIMYKYPRALAQQSALNMLNNMSDKEIMCWLDEHNIDL